MPTTVECERLLRGNGLRVTRPRVAVLTAVYDGLRALSDAGLVRHIQPPGSVARYESRVGDNHHHIVCRSCGAIADVDCAVGSAPCMTAPGDHGFSIDETEVIHRGLCPGCLADNTSDQSASSRKDPSA